MNDDFSLLDWLTAKLSSPSGKRWTRFGLAAVAVLWAVGLMAASGRSVPGLAYVLLVIAAILLTAGALAGGAAAPANLPALSLNLQPPTAPAQTWRARFRVTAPALLGLGGIFLVVLGQWLLSIARGRPLAGLIFLGLGVIWVVVATWRLGLDAAPPVVAAAPALEAAAGGWEMLVARWPIALVALIFSCLTFWAMGNNTVTVPGFCLWVASLAAWAAAFWEGRLWRQPDWSAWRERLRRPAWHFSVTRTQLLLVGVLVISAAFRFAQLDAVPGEMTSDHVEKLLDVNAILYQGVRPIFEPSNSGREVLMFYFSAFAAWLLNTGMTHLTLKLVAATVGFATLPFIFLLARELTDDNTTALLATLAAGVAWWPNVISRNGLRFPFAMFFSALVLWLLVRALRRRKRNTAILAGLFLGLGFYGYTPSRLLPLAVVVVIGAYVVHHAWRAGLGRAATWLVMVVVMTVAVAVPLWRYSIDEPQYFWMRTLTRIQGDNGNAVITGQTVVGNVVHAILMFSWTGDSAWLVSPPGQPALDFVMGGLFAAGVALLLYRYIRWRRWLDLLPLVLVPVLLLPSMLALAFPIENPSLHRASSAIPLVFLIVALPLRDLVEYGRHLVSQRWRWLAGAGLAACVLAVSAQVNSQILFVDYAASYRLSAQNASEIGTVMHDFARLVGSYDTVAVRPFPYWVDTRAAGMYALGGQGGQDFGHDFAISFADLGKWQSDPRPKLFILNRLDFQARPDGEPPTVPELRRLYPDGKLTLYPSKIPGHDFLLYSVPGTQDLDTSQLPPQ
jgi:hypothetical protein